MARALVSGVREQLVSFLRQKENQDPVSFLYRRARQGLELVVGGVDEEKVQKLITNFEDIQAVLEDAERKQVKEASVRRWLKKLKDVAYDVEDVLEDWKIAKHRSKLEREEMDAANEPFLKKVRYTISSSPATISEQFDIGKKIEEFSQRLDAIALEKDRYKFKLEKGVEGLERPRTVSFVDEKEVYGRYEEKMSLVNMLLTEPSTLEEESSLHVISIVGAGGIGKTTLAQLVFNHPDVQSHFDHKIWVCVSDPFDEIRIAKAILESLKNEAPNLNELETLVRNVRENLSPKKKILLVLDDVWNDDPSKWKQLKDSLKSCSPGSRIVITTRNEKVAVSMGTLSANIFGMQNLTEGACWLLFNRIAFEGRTQKECESLEHIGREIARKCKGLPLAAIVLGGLMRLKRTEKQWQCILESEIWEIEEVERGLFPPLLLSYYDMPSALKICFSYCAVFPKDKKIMKDQLINSWMAQGYLQGTECKDMETIGEEYFDELVMRSLFQDIVEEEEDHSNIHCKMHDIVHDCALYLTKTECFRVAFGGAKDVAIDLVEEARHLSLIYERGSSIVPESIHRANKLRSLLFDGCFAYEVLRLQKASLSKLFDQLDHLREVNLSYCLFEELPESIGRLMHLKCLSLSYNSILKELPEVVCDLFNLQTLDISMCSALEKLPPGLGKLSNLRHLRKFGVRLLWKGIEKLTCLRTLDVFVADGDTTNLGDLESLKHLQGHLSIHIFENVVLNYRGQARSAKLDVMKDLLGLKLHFPGRAADAIVLEALQPPLNLESLKIDGCGGLTAFPNWMVSLTKLKSIVLYDCFKWDCLPPLGKLSFLEELAIEVMQSIKRVGDDFLGVIQGQHEAPSSSASASSLSPVVAFPSLRSLRFTDMREWEEWDYVISSSTTTIMPNLQFLYIHRCPRLKSLPCHLRHATKLKELNVHGCPILEEWCNTGERINWPNIYFDRALPRNMQVMKRGAAFGDRRSRVTFTESGVAIISFGQDW